METKTAIHHYCVSVGILGVGAIGSAMAYFLLPNKKVQLHFYNRSPRAAIKIIQNTDKQSDTKHITQNVSIDCQTSISNSPNLDWLLICLKEHHFDEATPFLKQLITSKTRVAVIRNGLRHKEQLLPFTSSENILPCIIDCPCQPTTDGFYQSPKACTHESP